MPNHELKLAAVQDDITSDEPTVQSEPKQDLKQFGDFSLGEVAVAAVSVDREIGNFDGDDPTGTQGLVTP